MIKDDVADKYGVCLPVMDGGHLKDVKSHIVPSASSVKSAPSAKRSKYVVIAVLTHFYTQQITLYTRGSLVGQ